MRRDHFKQHIRHMHADEDATALIRQYVFILRSTTSLYVQRLSGQVLFIHVEIFRPLKNYFFLYFRHSLRTQWNSINEDCSYLAQQFDISNTPSRRCDRNTCSRASFSNTFGRQPNGEVPPPMYVLWCILCAIDKGVRARTHSLSSRYTMRDLFEYIEYFRI